MTSRYLKLNNLYFTETDLVNSNNFSIRRPYTTTSAASTTALNSTFLDQNSLTRFLNYTLGYTQEVKKTSTFLSWDDLYTKDQPSSLSTPTLIKLSVLNELGGRFRNGSFKTLLTYPHIFKEMGDNSDIKSPNYPLRYLLKKNFNRSFITKAFNKNQVLNSVSIYETPSSSNHFFNSSLRNTFTTSKEL